MNHLDLFSGIGGFALAARRVGWNTVGFCEVDPYCQKVLAKHWPGVPIYDDVRELSGDTTGPVDIITGGYPCQPFSVAGKRRGEDDDRHLWPEAYRLLRELRPSWAVFENVAGHITMGLDAVLSDLEGIGYAWETLVIPACAVDAKHRRDRVWIVGANTERQRLHERKLHGRISRQAECDDDRESLELGGQTSSEQVLANAERGRRQGQGQPEQPSDTTSPENGQAIKSLNGGIGPKWCPEPGVGRVANGIPNRVDRLKGLGNAIVPQVAEVIFRAINDELAPTTEW